MLRKVGTYGGREGEGKEGSEGGRKERWEEERKVLGRREVKKGMSE